MSLLFSMQVCRRCTGLLSCWALLLKGTKTQQVSPGVACCICAGGSHYRHSLVMLSLPDR